MKVWVPQMNRTYAKRQKWQTKMSACPSSGPKFLRVNTSTECCFITAYGTEVLPVQPKGHEVGSCECVWNRLFLSVCVSVGGVSTVHGVCGRRVSVCVPAFASQHTPVGARALLTFFIDFCWWPVVYICWGLSPQINLLFQCFFFVVDLATFWCSARLPLPPPPLRLHKKKP